MSNPTGYQAAEMTEVRQGETVVVFGAGPVGIFAAKSAWLLGADWGLWWTMWNSGLTL